MSYRKERVGFRFMNVSHDVAVRLHARVANATVRPMHGSPDRYVVSLSWLDPAGDYDWIGDAVHEHHLEEADYGLFVSLVTEAESAIVSVPDFARALFRRVGGRLDFSFTCLGPEEVHQTERDEPSVVVKPDGKSVRATRFCVRNNGTQKWHGYPAAPETTE
jgi:hypothetical protein